MTPEVVSLTPAENIEQTVETPSPVETSTPYVTITPTKSLAVPTGLNTTIPQPLLMLCSPLGEQSIQEIHEIISDPYNPPRPGKDDRHHGTDFAYYRRKDRTTIKGEEVQSLMAGRVAAIILDKFPYGNMVIVETPRIDLPPEIISQFNVSEDESLYVLYAHFDEPPYVKLGDHVDCGQSLGIVGATGYNIANPHLHIETRVGPSEKLFPEGMAYYDTRTSEAERLNYELWRTSGVYRHFDPMDLINEYLSSWAGE